MQKAVIFQAHDLARPELVDYARLLFDFYDSVYSREPHVMLYGLRQSLADYIAIDLNALIIDRELDALHDYIAIYWQPKHCKFNNLCV